MLSALLTYLIVVYIDTILASYILMFPQSANTEELTDKVLHFVEVNFFAKVRRLEAFRADLVEVVVALYTNVVGNYFLR